MSIQITATTNPQQIREKAGSYIHPGVKCGKRLFDIVFSCSALLLLLPLLPLLAIAIKLDSQGAVFYQQIRLGRSKAGDGNTFSIIKF